MVDPTVWGPPIWSTIHYVALGYPTEPTQEHMDVYRTFYMTIGRVLPCYKCRDNFQRHIEAIEPIEQALASRDSLFAWTVALHNMVNKDGKKPLMDVERAKVYYLGIAAASSTNALDQVYDVYIPQKTEGENKNMLIASMVGFAIFLATLLVALIAIKYLRSPRQSSQLRSGK